MNVTKTRGIGLAVVVALAGIIAGLIFLHHVRGARFTATATPVDMSSPDACPSLLAQPPYGVDAEVAHALCGGHESDIWFQIEVKNVGHRDAFVDGCHVTALDTAGNALYEGNVNVGLLGFPADPRLYAGDTLRYRWYLKPTPAGPAAPVDRYVASCKPIVYDGPIPV